jgi:membrane protein insertase Oxa1/YidC/SpoIIIJ
MVLSDNWAVRSCATSICTVHVNETKPLHVLCRVATIAVTTAAVRTLMLPVVVYQMKNTARMSVSLPLESSTSICNSWSHPCRHIWI